MNEKRRWITPANVVMLMGVLLTGYLLFSRPFVGVADNGDFSRVMNMAGLTAYDQVEGKAEHFFHFSHSSFSYSAPFQGDYISSQLVLLLPLRLLAEAVNPGYFDIRWLGVGYVLLNLMALWLVLRQTHDRSRGFILLLGGAILFVFFDAGYTAYFNSLYGEAATLTGCLLVFAAGLNLLSREHSLRASSLAGFFAAALFLTTAKLQNAPVGLLLALSFCDSPLYARINAGGPLRSAWRSPSQPFPSCSTGWRRRI
ncbi:hypothetical protein [Gorillibacterium massiliense]|uniref:glycan biosynthesis hexose transferase WsfD n=1 Tax=Gorillibacterium massiliense TaxID=1280390 RepID=UPI0004BA1EF6|nr:hypothetical protein [Gorillibacterium massiliense]